MRQSFWLHRILSMFFLHKKINAIEFIQLFSHLILKLCVLLNFIIFISSSINCAGAISTAPIFTRLENCYFARNFQPMIVNFGEIQGWRMQSYSGLYVAVILFSLILPVSPFSKSFYTLLSFFSAPLLLLFSRYL